MDLTITSKYLIAVLLLPIASRSAPITALLPFISPSLNRNRSPPNRPRRAHAKVDELNPNFHKMAKKVLDGEIEKRVSARHGNAPLEIMSVHGIDEEVESINIPERRDESEEETLIGGGSLNDLALQSGSRTGDPPIRTPLSDDEDANPDLPIVVSRPKRNIPKQVIVCDRRLRPFKSTQIDEDRTRWNDLIMKRPAAAAKREPPK